MIAAIAGKNVQQSLWSYGYHTSAIVALTSFHNDREEWFLYDCNDCWAFFFSAITEIVATVRKPAFIFNTFRLFTRASILDPVVHLLWCHLSVTRQIVYMTVPFGSIIHSFMWFWPAQFMCLFLKYTKKCLNILSYRGTENALSVFIKRPKL